MLNLNQFIGNPLTFNLTEDQVRVAVKMIGAKGALVIDKVLKADAKLLTTDERQALRTMRKHFTVIKTSCLKSSTGKHRTPAETLARVLTGLLAVHFISESLAPALHERLEYVTKKSTSIKESAAFAKAFLAAAA